MAGAAAALAFAPAIGQGEEIASAARGHLIAVGGGPSGAGSACFACHGLNGEGDAGAAFPRLAGLDARYLAKQLEDYARETRPNAVMSPIARQLSPRDRASVALYYAGLPAAARVLPAGAGLNTGRLQLGATLYAQGLPARGVQGCANCHGPGGHGLNRVYPPIAGQPAAYVDLQLRLWRDGTRHNDISGIMRHPAQRLTDDDIAAVAAYVAGLPP